MPSSHFTRPSLINVLSLCACALLSVAACSKPAQQLTVKEGWVRLSPPGSMMTAGYGTFENTGEQALVLTGITSPQFGDVTLHYTEDTNGTATMREAKNYRLEAGDTLTLAPGGYHLMLMQRTAPTPENSAVEVTLMFASGASSTHNLTVTKR